MWLRSSNSCELSRSNGKPRRRRAVFAVAVFATSILIDAAAVALIVDLLHVGVQLHQRPVQRSPFRPGQSFRQGCLEFARERHHTSMYGRPLAREAQQASAPVLGVLILT